MKNTWIIQQSKHVCQCPIQIEGFSKIYLDNSQEKFLLGFCKSSPHGRTKKDIPHCLYQENLLMMFNDFKPRSPSFK